MERDDSFDEYSIDDHRFIALEVSDNDEDIDSVSYNSSIATRTNTQPVDTPAKRTASNATSIKKSPHTNDLSPSSNNTKMSSERKRWSLISNHSSSSKKRWSVLSSFTMESNGKESKRIASQSSGNKRISSTSSSNTNNSFVGNNENSSDHHSTNSNSRSSSMKRSSTGQSLRHLFNKISISDKEVTDSNKENQSPFIKEKAQNVAKSHTVSKSIDLSKASNTSTFRTPLTPLANNNTPYERRELRNHRSMLIQNNRNSFQHPSQLHPSPSNNSFAKWKFWKKNADSNPANNQSMPKSVSTQSLNKNLRTKTSFSDFHKSLFSSNDKSDNSSIHTSTTQQYIRSKRSSSSLSIPGLKHKTSHSSLQKFKSRRKSNTLNDDGSSFISIASSSNSGSIIKTTSNNISLPMPDEVSREKIRAKLKNSTSLLSLTSATPINKRQYDENIITQILNITSTKHILTDAELEQNKDSLEVLPHHGAIKLSTNVSRMISTRDNRQTIICKKISLDTDPLEMTLNELEILNLVKGTTGLPNLLQSYIHKSSPTPSQTHPLDPTNDNYSSLSSLTLYMFIKDHGAPLERINIHSWSQCLKIFWQCVSLLYVAETKFKFEHRNLTLDHILIDHHGNVTLCDMETGRAQSNYQINTEKNENHQNIFFTRLDHPIFYQSKKEHAFDVYQTMRSFFNGEGTWSSFEPRTNLLWLHYVCAMLLQANSNNKFMGPGRDSLNKMMALLEYSCIGMQRKNALLFKRKDLEIQCVGDLMKYK